MSRHVTPCNLVRNLQRFEPSKTILLLARITLQLWRRRLHVPSKHLYTSTRFHGVTSQKTILSIFAPSEIWNSCCIPGKVEQISLQTGSGTLPLSYPVGTGTLPPVVKRPRREADYSPSSSVEVENTWSYTSIPEHVFMVKVELKLSLCLTN
jgi:hypothetical protein